MPHVYYLNFSDSDYSFKLCHARFDLMEDHVKTRSQLDHEQRHERFLNYMTYSMYNGYCDCLLCIGALVFKGTTKVCLSVKRKLFP